jgi:hypothetical protein
MAIKKFSFKNDKEDGVSIQTNSDGIKNKWYLERK